MPLRCQAGTSPARATADDDVPLRIVKFGGVRPERVQRERPHRASTTSRTASPSCQAGTSPARATAFTRPGHAVAATWVSGRNESRESDRVIGTDQEPFEREQVSGRNESRESDREHRTRRSDRSRWWCQAGTSPGRATANNIPPNRARARRRSRRSSSKPTGRK